MKVLRIYDHLGELKKEFQVYVEGEDFMWQASYPEPVWLGRIVLEDAGKEPSKPIEELSRPLESGLVVEEVAITGEFAPEPEVIEPKPKVEEKEVKDESKSVYRKRGRVKRTTPPGDTKSVKTIHQDNARSDSNKGD